MTEQDRINKDFEHFKATGDDYPYHQRAYDKRMIDKLFSAFVWCVGIAFCALCWFLAGSVIVEIISEMMR